MQIGVTAYLSATVLFWGVHCFPVSAGLLSTNVTPFSCGSVVTDPLVLRDAACDILPFFKEQHRLTLSPCFGRIGIQPNDALRTLSWLIKLVDEDKPTGRFRILNPSFLNKHFKIIRWSGDAEGAEASNVVIPPGPDGGKLRDGRIKLTSYAVFTVNGGYRKSDRFSVPLYGYSRHNSKTHGSFGQRMLLNENGRGLMVEPLAWVSPQDADDALMQGSVIVKMPDGKRRTFYVHASREVSDRKTGKKYRRWFFREFLGECSSKNRYNRIMRIVDHPWAVLAGDVRQLGIGKLIALNYTNPVSKKDEIRLGVLSDTGEAFQNNLYQLDLYAGVFDSRAKFKRQLRNLPNTVQAYFLIKK